MTSSGEPMGLAWRLLKWGYDPVQVVYQEERSEKMDELTTQYAQRMIDEGTPEKGWLYPHQMANPSSVPRSGVRIGFGHLPEDSPEVNEYGEWMMSHPYIIEQNRLWSNEFDMGSYKNPETNRYRMMPRSEIFEIRHPGILGSQEMPTLQDPYGPYVEWLEGKTLPEAKPSKKSKFFWEKGEPMDLAFRLLKASRQTELGEFHEDLPSSHGPVTGYRALSDEQHKKIPHEGLTGTPIKPLVGIRDNPPKKGIYAWMGHTPTGLDFAREEAQNWANEMSNNRDTPSRVVGIRGRHDLSHMDDFANDWYGITEPEDLEHAAAHILPHDIPPEQVVRQI